MRKLLTILIIAGATNAHAAAPQTAKSLFEMNSSEPIEFVSQSANLCSDTSVFRNSELERASNDLVMGVMLAAKESGMQIEIVEEEICPIR